MLAFDCRKNPPWWKSAAYMTRLTRILASSSQARMLQPRESLNRHPCCPTPGVDTFWLAHTNPKSHRHQRNWGGGGIKRAKSKKSSERSTTSTCRDWERGGTLKKWQLDGERCQIDKGRLGGGGVGFVQSTECLHNYSGGMSILHTKKNSIIRVRNSILRMWISIFHKRNSIRRKRNSNDDEIWQRFEEMNFVYEQLIFVDEQLNFVYEELIFYEELICHHCNKTYCKI